jgi:hypothetical protein
VQSDEDDHQGDSGELGERWLMGEAINSLVFFVFGEVYLLGGTR